MSAVSEREGSVGAEEGVRADPDPAPEPEPKTESDREGSEPIDPESSGPESIDLEELSIKERIVLATIQRPTTAFVLVLLLLIAFTFLIAFLMYVAFAVT